MHFSIGAHAFVRHHRGWNYIGFCGDCHTRSFSNDSRVPSDADILELLLTSRNYSSSALRESAWALDLVNDVLLLDRNVAGVSRLLCDLFLLLWDLLCLLNRPRTGCAIVSTFTPPEEDC